MLENVDSNSSLALSHTQQIGATMATTAASVRVAVRTLFIVLACIMVAGSAYFFAFNGFSTCFVHRWTHVVLVDFFITIAIIWAWFVYKESSWIMGAAFLFLLLLLGGIATCGYIVLQFYKLSLEESCKDPLYFVLVRRVKGDAMGQRRGPSVLTAKIIFSALGCLMLGSIGYALITDGSPFQSKLFTPCMIATLIDTYIHIVVFSVWVAFKESRWTSAFFWIVLLLCFRSVTICVYIVRQLFYLSPHEPISLIIFSKSNRDLQSSDPLLMAHPDI